MTLSDKRATADCSCRITGPGYEQTRFDPACPYHGESGSMVAVVKLSDRRPKPVKPCPSKVAGPFLGSDATEVRCSQLEGHDGPHFAHVEWTSA